MGQSREQTDDSATDAPRAESHRRERLFRALVEQSRDLISVVDEDGLICYVNPAVESLLGYTVAERLGQHPTSIVHEDDRQRVRDELSRVMAEPGRTASMRVRLLHRDGSTRLFDLEGHNHLGDPAVRGIVVDGRDVTDRVAAEERLRHVAASSPAVLYSLATLDGGYAPTWVSENVQAVTGYTVEEALDPEWWPSHIHPDDRERALRQSAGVLEQERVAHEYRFRFADGVYRWIRDQLHVAQAPDGSEAIVGSWMDVNEFHRLEFQFQQSQKLEAIGRLAGGIAHDYNNILTAISGGAHFLLEDLPEDSPSRADADEILQNTERAARLTRQLLAFGRKQILARQTLDLGRLVHGMTPMLRRLLGEDLELRVDNVGGGMVEGDPGQLEQVVMNLVINARDAMPTGGRLSIRIATGRPTVDEAAGFEVEPGDYVLFEVSDTGVGMDRETLTRIYEPFFTTKEGGRGTGLGLSTVYGIIKQSGGYVFADSTPGGGTTFRIYLPRVQGELHTLEHAPSERGDLPEGRGEVVLVVEDEDAVRQLAQRVLARNGYEVLEARSAGDALLLAERHDGSIDLLLTDVVMPKLDGPRLAARLRERLPRLVVLFMSGYDEEEVARRRVAKDGGVLLQKPFTPRELLEAVRAALTV